jgi:hypothetical protein
MGAFLVGRNRRRELAGNGGVELVERAGCAKSLRRRTENHGEDSAECVVEALNWLGKQGGVLIECGGYPRMCKLQKGSAAGSEKECGFTIDAPGNGIGSEDAGEGIVHARLRGSDVEFEVMARDRAGGIGGEGRRHRLIR